MTLTNPITETLFEIHKHEIVNELVASRRLAKTALGEEYIKTMRQIKNEITALQSKGKEPMSFFLAGYILANWTDEEETPEETKQGKTFIYACIAEVYLTIYNYKYGLEDED